MSKKKGQTSPADGVRVLVRNRRATHDYAIDETVEAGIVLVGSEVKSLRDAKATIADGHVEFRRGEAWLIGITINEYPWANQFNHEPGRDRKLLLHKREIDRLATRVQQRGVTIVPMSIYLKGGTIKVELGLGTGKKLYEKREAAREADARREIDRAMKGSRRSE